MSKEPPKEFDPHPGDPWHPAWVEDEAAEPSAEPTDEEWWQSRLDDTATDGEPASTPEAYAVLEGQAPTDGQPPPAVDAVARAFAAEYVPASTQSPIIEEAAPKLDPDVAAVAVVAETTVEPPTVEPPTVEPTITIDLREPEAEPDPLPETALEHEPEPAPELELVPAAEPSPEEVAAAAAVADVRAREHAAELALVDRLAIAEQTAHEESRMWTLVAAERDSEVTAGAGDTEAPAVVLSSIRGDDWAAEALAIEESRQRFVERRERTEAEVRHALEHVAEPLREQPKELDDGAQAARRFAAIAAQFELAEAAELDRNDRNELLRLRTSLLVLDAEQPWDEGGWSRPGRSFKSDASIVPGAVMTLKAPRNVDSRSPVAESTSRRRWSWSRKRNTPTTPDASKDSPGSVVVIEEQAVSAQKDDTGDDEGQSVLPFDDASVDSPDLANPVDPADDGGLEDELAAWDDFDWGGEGFADEDAASADAPSATDEADSSRDIRHDDQDSTVVPDWEEFTAEEYVQTATQEYADLAAAVAAAEGQVAEQAAVAADMPGLESSLVGLHDVVEAEGMETAAAAPRSDLAMRVVTSLALVALFFASLVYQWSIGTLVLAVMTVAAGELATVLVRQGRHPVALFAYLGTLGLLGGTWAYGLVAVPFALGATLLVVLMFFGLVAGRQDPLVSMALTMLPVLWVGVLAAFAMEIVRADEYRWLIGSLVFVVAIMDIAQYFVGKRLGKRPLAPVVSPKKTVAGLVGGVVAAIGVGYGLSFLAPFDATTGVVLGAAVAVSGPIGDLAVSVLKRTLSIKDMGTILPGHGGVLDRIDAILFSIPVAWLVFASAGLLG